MISAKTVWTVLLLMLLISQLITAMHISEKDKAEALPAEKYKNLTTDGTWCWFSDPRAVYYEGKKKAVYAGWVNSRGDVVVASYDFKTGCTDTFVVHEKFEIDDHANPSILIRNDGRLMVFYSKHSAKDSPLMMRASIYPENIRFWEAARPLLLDDNSIYYDDLRRDYCYTYPSQLKEENGKIYLFWRGINFKPCVSTSGDGGKTWDKGRIFILPEEKYKNQRPYLKMASNGKNRLHFAFTDGHPKNEPTNSIYYACYRNNALFKANGEKISDWSALPLKPQQCDQVYDAGKTKVRAWIWDVAEDEKGYPVIVYTRMPQETEHFYHYARWDGIKWQDYKLTRAGKWFPKTPAGEKEREPFYSGGIVLDHANPSIVYLSRPIAGVFEIEKWTTADQGKSWKKQAITAASQNDNVRPFVIRHNSDATGPDVLWLNVQKYSHYTDYLTNLKMDVVYKPLSTEVKPDAIIAAMTRVADWQLTFPAIHPARDWSQAAWYAGLMAWSQMSDDPVYLDSLMAVSERNQWQLGDRKYHADDHSVGWTYLQLYTKYGDVKMLEPVQKNFDWLLANRSAAGLEFNTPNCHDRWCWCDALFMSPPVLTKLSVLTGEKKYLDFMNQEWWATTDYLYDKEEHLYYRDSRYFAKREKNGKKIFWSRGNGWVIAGLARVLEDLPQDYPDYPRYVSLFREMAEKIAALQLPDGLWRPSLLDPESYPQPETSGSGFYCFVLAWGINNGILQKEKYLPVVQNAWAGLVRSIRPSGKLGFVQPIAADPSQVNAEMTEVYGSGAFLLAGSQVYPLALLKETPRLKVNVQNTLGLFRRQETVVLNWQDVAMKLPSLNPADVAVFCQQDSRFLVTQILVGDERQPAHLLFQSHWAPYETRTFWLMPKAPEFIIPEAKEKSFGMYVPQRKEDFSWESDRIAFRMYGKALEDETVSSGVDVWVKSVRYPVIEKWYRSNDYHTDHGEGLDFFKVGPSRGCGGSAIWKNDKQYGSRNYRTWKILANGPIRTIFELGYEPWQAENVTVSEVKRISIDLGSNLSRFESRFTATEDKLDMAVGLVKIQNGGEITYNIKDGWMSYWQPADPVNGVIGCGTVIPAQDNLRFTDPGDHGLFIVPVTTDKPFLYYAGASWNKSLDFPNRESWNIYLEEFAQQIKNPLRIKVE